MYRQGASRRQGWGCWQIDSWRRDAAWTELTRVEGRWHVMRRKGRAGQRVDYRTTRQDIAHHSSHHSSHHSTNHSTHPGLNFRDELLCTNGGTHSENDRAFPGLDPFSWVGPRQSDSTRPVSIEYLLTRPVRFRKPPDPPGLDPLKF